MGRNIHEDGYCAGDRDREDRTGRAQKRTRIVDLEIKLCVICTLLKIFIHQKIALKKTVNFMIHIQKINWLLINPVEG